MLQVSPIQTKIFSRKQSLKSFLIENLRDHLKEGMILAVTSKLVSVAEDRFIKREEIEKLDLIKRESDVYMGACAYDCHLTIKEGLLIPSAGIDESNSEEDHYILYPEDPFESAQRIQGFLKAEFKLKSLGVILTDSHTTPLRKGVVGAALAYCGFRGVIDRVGSKDLFGREMKMTQVNLADALAVSATLTMGEGDERCPLAVLNYPVEFMDLDDNEELKIPLEQDIYYPILKKALQP